MRYLLPILLFISIIICGDVLCGVVHVEPEPVEKAVCVILSPFTNINGLVTFDKEHDGVLVNGKIGGLTPGLHAMHIHEKGDIRDPKCSTTGAHFNPFHKQHGGVSSVNRHLGDLGNIHADDLGIAIFTFKDKLLILDGPNSIIGRSLVIHELMDDLGQGGGLESKKNGGAGNRIACGVIGYA